MTNARFRRVLSAGTVIGAFCSVGVLSAQSFVPTEPYQDPQFQQFQQQHQQVDPLNRVPYQGPLPPYTGGNSAEFPAVDLSHPQTQYLACMQAAEVRKEQVAVQLYAWMYQQKTLARQRQAQGRIAAWSIPDDRARRDELRRVDNEYRDVLRAIDDQFDDVADEVTDRYRDEKRDCERLKREGGSRSSRSFSSSPWWQPYSSSSSAFNPQFQNFQHSSFPGTAGVPVDVGAGVQGCAPMVCSNGRVFPRCSPDGYPINYFTDPCTFH